MDKVIAQARQWLGVPFRHQGRSRKGCDCLGLLIGVAGELGLKARDGRRLVTWDERGYGRLPDEKRLKQALAAALWEIEIREIAAGDVVLMEVDGRVQHLGMVAPYAADDLGIIHAYAPFGKVVEHRLTKDWEKRIHHVFRIL